MWFRSGARQDFNKLAQNPAWYLLYRFVEEHEARLAKLSYDEAITYFEEHFARNDYEYDMFKLYLREQAGY